MIDLANLAVRLSDRSSHPRKHRIAMAAIALLIPLGFASPSSIYGVLVGDFPMGKPGELAWFVAAIAVFSPLLPAGAFLLTETSKVRFSRYLTLPLVAIGAPAGFMFSAIAGFLSGAGASLIFIHGLSLTLIVLSTLLLITRSMSGILPLIGLALLIPPTILAIWSIVVVPTLSLQALRMAASKPYCIAQNGAREAVRSFADLRGLEFYTTRSGYKDTSRWFYHGVLITADGDRLTAYNWSYRLMRFDTISNPQQMMSEPLTDCKPEAGFLGSLRMI